MNLDRLEQLAENATPGPWEHIGEGQVWARWEQAGVQHSSSVAIVPLTVDVDFIAAADPSTVAALVKVAKAATLQYASRECPFCYARQHTGSSHRNSCPLADLEVRLSAANHPHPNQQGEGT